MTLPENPLYFFFKKTGRGSVAFKCYTTIESGDYPGRQGWVREFDLEVGERLVVQVTDTRNHLGVELAAQRSENEIRLSLSCSPGFDVFPNLNMDDEITFESNNLVTRHFYKFDAENKIIKDLR